MKKNSVIMMDASNMISLAQVDYMNEQGDFDPPAGDQVSKLLNAATKRCLDDIVETLIDDVAGKSIREVLKRAAQGAEAAISEEIRMMPMDETVRPQVMSALARNSGEPHNLGNAYADIMAEAKNIIVSHLMSGM